MKQDMSRSVSHFSLNKFAPQEAGAKDYWWTPARDAKLKYVMETYDDLQKASRVLGCSERVAIRRWYKIRKANSK